MKDIDDPGGGSAYDNAIPLDPTSISLFSDEVPRLPPSAPAQPHLSNGITAASVNRQASFASVVTKAPRDGPVAHGLTAAASKDPIQKPGERRKLTNYSTYMQGKATEVAKRRRLNERIEKMKNTRGIIFNVPQCKEITTNQLAIFLRRLRKSQDVRLIMSPQLMSTIFQDEALPKSDPDVDRKQLTSRYSFYNGHRDYSTENYSGFYGNNNKQSSKHPAVISVSDILGEKDDASSMPSTSSGMSHHHHQHYVNGGAMDGDSTESSSDSEWEDDRNAITSSVSEKTLVNGGGMESSSLARLQAERDKQISVDDYQFYKKRMQIVSADLRAITYYKHYTETQERVSKTLLPEEFQFEPAPRTGDEESDSQTCARVRPLTNRPKRRVFRHTHLERRNLPATVIKPNLRCGVAEYAAVDDSIHPLLSLESSIPMERKLQKYMHLSSMLAPEVERRRQKIAELALKRAKSSMKPLFYSTDELQIPEEESSKSPTSISLTLKKRLLKEAESAEVQAAPPPAPVGRPRVGRPKSQRTSVSVNEDDVSRDHNEDQFDDDNDSSMTFDEAEDDEYYRPRQLTRRRVTHGGQPSKRSAMKEEKSGSNSPSVLLPNLRRTPRSAVPNKKYVTDNSVSTSKMATTKNLPATKSKINGNTQGGPESRRSSMHNIGRDESVFDFDSTFTDIGLTAVQNVETKEILIPQFTRKEVLDPNLKKPCECCPFFTESDPFERIRQTHEVLEAQERMRFKSITAARSRTSQAH